MTHNHSAGERLVPWYVVIWRIPFVIIISLLMVLIYFMMVLAYGISHANNWINDNLD